MNYEIFLSGLWKQAIFLGLSECRVLFPLILFGWFFPWLGVIFLHKCGDQYTAECTSRTLYRPFEFFFNIALASPVLQLANSSHLGSFRLSIVSSTQRMYWTLLVVSLPVRRHINSSKALSSGKK